MGAHDPTGPADFRAWVGRTEQVEDALAPAQARAAAALFDLDPAALQEDTPLPSLWHWFYFLAPAPQSALGDDGHPRRGGFLPPIPLPRRMFAGSRLRFHRALAIGRPARRLATILGVETKTGRSGSLAFVTVGLRYEQDGNCCIEEEQQIVYREPGAPVAAPPVRPWSDAPPEATTRVVSADSRLLFRFSALTFNAHRIHYDRDYATRTEGYPGLVVHGPLTAMLLAMLAERAAGRTLSGFRFRGLAPLFDGGPVRLAARVDGDVVALDAHGPDGTHALTAQATLG